MKIPPTTMMTDIIVRIMVEVLSVLALATKQVKQGRLSRFTITFIADVSLCDRIICQKAVREERG